MAHTIIDGKAVSDSILRDLRLKVKQYHDRFDRDPGLAVVLVGDNPASRFYVESKKKACRKIGINSYDYRLSPSEGEGALIDLIHHLNSDDDVHGILVQLPLPADFDEQKIIELIHPDKDVDGFHALNIGRVWQGLSGYRSCTPYGVFELLTRYNIPVEGKHVVIVGRSNIVGKPLASILVQKAQGCNATVTICHSRSEDLKAISRQADILVAAIGVPEFLTADMVKPGATVIDVGINRVSDSTSDLGYRIVGDVAFQEVSQVAGAITPVPGGVGPMTIAMLMSNTITAFERTLGIDPMRSEKK